MVALHHPDVLPDDRPRDRFVRGVKQHWPQTRVALLQAAYHWVALADRDEASGVDIEGEDAVDLSTDVSQVDPAGVGDHRGAQACMFVGVVVGDAYSDGLPGPLHRERQVQPADGCVSLAGREALREPSARGQRERPPWLQQDRVRGSHRRSLMYVKILTPARNGQPARANGD